MLISLYSFSKRINSTKIPSGDPAQISCTLKDGTEVTAPVLILQQTDNIYHYNYVYIPMFSRYYFIDSYRAVRGVWEITCRVDTLASWLTYIRASSAQVISSSSSYSLNLIDNRIPATGTVNRNIEVAEFTGASMGGSSTAPNGTFCLTVLDNTGIWATGAATTYFMTYKQMQTFAKELVNPAAWESIKQFWDNPMDGIIECYYLPIDISSYIDRTTERSIVIGDYIFPSAKGRSALATNLALKWHNTSLLIPWQYSDFRNLPPYSNVELYVPFCGSKPLPASELYNFERVLVDYGVDITTGAVQVIAYVKETVLQEWSGNIKVTLPVGQTQSRAEQIIGGVSGAVTAIAGYATGNYAAAAGGVLGAIGSVISPTDQKTMGGCNGSVLGAILGNNTGRWQEFRCTVTYHETFASPSSIRAIMGNVNGNVVSLSGLTGYCQTNGASVSAPCTAEELNQINTLLDGGIYFE